MQLACWEASGVVLHHATLRPGSWRQPWLPLAEKGTLMGTHGYSCMFLAQFQASITPPASHVTAMSGQSHRPRRGKTASQGVDEEIHRRATKPARPQYSRDTDAHNTRVSDGHDKSDGDTDHGTADADDNDDGKVEDDYDDTPPAWRSSKTTTLAKKGRGQLRKGQRWWVVLDRDMHTPRRNHDGTTRRFAASTAEAAALQSYRTFMRSKEGRAVAKAKWSSFSRPTRAQDAQLRDAREATRHAVDGLVDNIRRNLSRERLAKVTTTWSRRLAKGFVLHCRPTFERAKVLRSDPTAVTDEEVDQLLQQVTQAWWIKFNRPLQDEADDRFLYNFYCLTHVRLEDEPGAPPTTFLCCFHRILRPSWMEFVEAITYKTHQRKIPMDTAATLSSSQAAKAYVKRIKQAMSVKHNADKALGKDPVRKPE